MENQKYIKESIFSYQKKKESDDYKLSFEIQQTNELNPVYDIHTLEINLNGPSESEACFSFDMDEFKSFKNYINKLYKHCKKFNELSKNPIKDE